MKNICVPTGTRADYGLLYYLLKGIDDSDKLNLQLIVTGTHLSDAHGLTIEEIRKDGFAINETIENIISSDNPASITKSTALALMGFGEAYKRYEPDLVLILGDRFEMLAAATAALIADIPIMHLHGGELTFGAYDDAIRHSITKMSTWHCVATNQYRNRVIQLGENPDNVYVVGGLGIDNINKLNLLTKQELQSEINFDLKDNGYLVTYHPVTKDGVDDQGLTNLLNVLQQNKEAKIIFTLPNADVNSNEIVDKIYDFIDKNPQRSVAFKSMGQLKYLSAMKYVKAVVGNSSSGIIEAPSFKTATINIGNRQEGRIRAASIVDCDMQEKSIKKAFEKIESNVFKDNLKTVTNPYGNGGATESILNLLHTVKKTNKKFFDIKI